VWIKNDQMLSRHKAGQVGQVVAGVEPHTGTRHKHKQQERKQQKHKQQKRKQQKQSDARTVGRAQKGRFQNQGVGLILVGTLA
jgi:hypothetical protein